MYTDILILATLRLRPRHGYEIKKSLARSFPGLAPLTNSVLYPALRRFEEAGAVERETIQQIGKPNRHLYRLTPQGEALLADLLRDFPPETARSEIEFTVRATYFALLDAPARLRILGARRQVLHERLAGIPTLREATRASPLLPYVHRVLDLREREIQTQLRWIEELIEQEERQ